MPQTNLKFFRGAILAFFMMLIMTAPIVQAQSISNTSPITAVTTTPSSFNPNINKAEVQIIYSKASSETASTDMVQILDSNNTVRRTINHTEDNAQCVPGSCQYPLFWDGRDDSGNLLSPGNYTVKVTSTNDSGTTTNSTTVKITNDPPTAPTIISVSNSSFDPLTVEIATIHYEFSENGIPAMSETALILDSNKSVRAELNQDQTTFYQTKYGDNYCALNQVCDYTLVWDGRDINGKILPPGIYTVHLSVTNLKGTSTNDTATVTINNDNPYNAPVFGDVLSDSPYKDAVTYLKANNIVSGYDDGTFRPAFNINRAEFTKIVVEASPNFVNNGLCMENFARSNGSSVTFHDASDMFLDVLTKDNAWYDNYLCWAKTSNWISGYPDGTFRPAQNINFVEAAKIIVNANKLSVPATLSSDPWYKGYVEALASQHAIPTTITNFQQNMTRGEMAEIIYRLKANITNKSSQKYDSLSAGHLNTTETSINDLPHPAGQTVYAECQNATTGNLVYVWFKMGVDTGSYGYYDETGNEVGTYSYMVPSHSSGQQITTANCTAMSDGEFRATVKDATTMPQ